MGFLGLWGKFGALPGGWSSGVCRPGVVWWGLRRGFWDVPVVCFTVGIRGFVWVAVGKDGVSRLFMEYLMVLVGKAERLDKVKALIEAGGSLDEVRGII